MMWMMKTTIYVYVTPSIFDAWRYASTVCCHHVSVRPSVCPSQVGVLHDS